jgi:CubicO group peptidase (beta-lactamase class C family)
MTEHRRPVTAYEREERAAQGSHDPDAGVLLSDTYWTGSRLIKGRPGPARSDVRDSVFGSRRSRPSRTRGRPMPTGASVQIHDADLAELCAQHIKRLGIAGAQIAIACGDTLVHAEAGVANNDLGTPVMPDTVFQIGSTSKVFTATMIMQLADEGRVDIDEPVAGYLPDVRLATGDEWRGITPRQLMSMSSGLDNGPYTDTGRNDDCVARYVDLLADIPLTFSPGTAYGYSNASTNVSGLLIERLTGQCWDEALRDRLLRTAGLAEAVSLFEDLPYYRVAIGNLPDGEPIARPWCFGRGCGPAGSSLATSARELVSFGQIFLRGGVAADGTRILTESAVATMQSRQVEVPARVFADAWCVGPYAKDWDGLAVFGHSGTTHNGSSTLLWIPAHKLAIATVVNTPPRGYPFADAVFDTVLRDWLGLPKPVRPTPKADLSPDTTPYLGRYDAHGVYYQVAQRDHALELTVRRMRDHNPLSGELEDAITTTLRPIAAHRFLPADDAVTRYHNWDIAFTLGPDGRAVLLNNGAFAARRAD